MSKLETKDKLIQIRVTSKVLAELRDNALRHPGGGTLGSYLVYCGLNPPKVVGAQGRPSKEPPAPRLRIPDDSPIADAGHAVAVYNDRVKDGKTPPFPPPKHEEWVAFYTEDGMDDEDDMEDMTRKARHLGVRTTPSITQEYPVEYY